MAKAKAKEGKTAFAVTLGGRLNPARGERTLQDVANATNGFVHPRMIANYEEGTEPRYSTLVVLAAALGVQVSDLVPASVTAASKLRDPEKLVSLITG